MNVLPIIPNLIEIRIKKGLSQRDLAKKAGLSSTFISQLENKKRNIGPKSAEKIYTALGVDFDDIFFISYGCTCKQNNDF